MTTTSKPSMDDHAAMVAPRETWDHRRPIALPEVTDFAELFTDVRDWRSSRRPKTDANYVPDSENDGVPMLRGAFDAAKFYGNCVEIMGGKRPPEDGTATISHYLGGCRMKREGGSGPLWVNPTPAVIDAIRTHTIDCGQRDRITFEVVEHENGWSLVIAKHSIIGGGVWLAYVRSDSVPRGNPSWFRE